MSAPECPDLFFGCPGPTPPFSGLLRGAASSIASAEKLPKRPHKTTSQEDSPSSDRRVEGFTQPEQVEGQSGVIVTEENDQLDGESSDEDSPFFIARKLLRCRHVRKEQLQKERGAARHKRKKKLSIDTGVNNPRKKLPRLSPVLIKVDSLANLDGCDDSIEDSPVKEEISSISSVTDAFSSRMPPYLSSELSSFTFSPVRPRAKRMAFDYSVIAMS